VARIVNSGRAQFERRFTTGIVERLPVVTIERLEQIAAPIEEPPSASIGVLAELKSDPGRPSLNTVLEEIDKLERVIALGLPAGLFADCSEKLIAPGAPERRRRTHRIYGRCPSRSG
jgi:hypothetical protein